MQFSPDTLGRQPRVLVMEHSKQEHRPREVRYRSNLIFSPKQSFRCQEVKFHTLEANVPSLLFYNSMLLIVYRVNYGVFPFFGC